MARETEKLERWRDGLLVAVHYCDRTIDGLRPVV